MRSKRGQYCIEIHDSDNGVLTVTLQRILDALGDSVSTLHWRLLSLWAVGELPGGRSILDYEQLAESSKDGLFLPWCEVILLADNVSQIIDCVFVAFEPPVEPGLALSFLGPKKDAVLVVEAIDSTFWRVASQDVDNINQVEQYFSDVTRC